MSQSAFYTPSPPWPVLPKSMIAYCLTHAYNNKNEYVFFIDGKLMGHITPVDAVIARVSFMQRISVKSLTIMTSANYVP
jgi:hypothetical protein